MSVEVLDRLPERLTVPSTNTVSSPGTRLSVVIPAYREAKHIAANLRKLLKELDDL